MLPITGITTNLISSTLGISSSDIGMLIAKAKKGGTNGYAFNITENGGSDGYLIDGATSTFNPFSTNSPGVFEKSGTSIKFKLKNNGGYTGNYSFTLGDFRNYDHSAVPIYFSVSSALEQANSWNKFTFYIEKGSYDFSTLLAEQYGIKFALKVYNSAGTTLLTTLYCSDAITSDVYEYYGSGTYSTTSQSDYTVELAIVNLKADGTVGTVAYSFQNLGDWFNPKVLLTTGVVPPSDLPSYSEILVDVPVDVTEVSSNFSWYAVGWTKVSAGFKCLDYLSIPSAERTKGVYVSVYDIINNTYVYAETYYQDITIRSTNNVSINVPVAYSEMNRAYTINIY